VRLHPRSVVLALALTLAGPALADDVPPVQVQIKEREPGAFLVQWFVPSVIPAQAMPHPELPAHCRPDGERVVLSQSGGWLNRQAYRCPGGLAGHTIGIRYPVPNPSVRTVMRLELLSGERFAHALAAMESAWQVPEANVGPIVQWLRDARSAVVSGARHIVVHWVHVALILALVLLGGVLGSIRFVTAFAVGQVVAVAVTALVARPLDAVVAEICVAIAVVFLAREALRAEPQAQRVTGLAAATGLFHGVALAALLPATPEGSAVQWSHLLVLVLGMDAALLVLGLIAALLGRLVARRWPAEEARGRTALAYVLGSTAVAALLSLAFVRPAGDVTATTTAPRLPGAGAPPSAAGMPTSRRVATQRLDIPIQSYLAVEPFEVRHEALLRLQDLATAIGLRLPGDGYLEVAEQDRVARRIADHVASRTFVEIDGTPAAGLVDRVSFMTVDAQGVLPRQTPVRETVDEAFLGVTVAYLTSGMPNEATLSWATFPAGTESIPATAIDPESSRSTTLTPDEPVLRWENELMESPVPTVAAVAVEPPRLPLPLVSLLLAGLAVAFVAAGWRRDRRLTSSATARVTLALAFALTPLLHVSVTLPTSFGGVTSPHQARRVLASVLPNVYRAFEFREEGAAYDRLAVAVTGPTLTDIYLEHQRAMVMEERGGARARVDAVEVTEVRSVAPREGGGFDAEASWTVGGTVTHFGHRHFRQNRYDTRVVVVPVDGTWKIESIEILEQERVR
jgi:hypothetical protein